MIDGDRWLNSLAYKSDKSKEGLDEIDSSRWINTISKKNSYGSVKKHSLIGVSFICGLILVSVVKNETRHLEKEISNLQSSISVIRFNLEQAILDNEVITSPENVVKLAKEHLNNELSPYKISQIKHIDNKDKNFSGIDLTKKETINKREKIRLASLKSKVKKKIENKRMEIKKLQDLYSDPETVSEEVKLQISKQIKNKKEELQNIYDSPKEAISLAKIQRWGAVQLVKAFLGIPVIPGR